ncbi:DNA repair protein RadA [Candidatus Saccharibacteria bacterium]|jgi:DNA repair protein RadA/Sms|nr:DNA repair protein RadA [Candidatus Saccharibacteria bacterium]
MAKRNNQSYVCENCGDTFSKWSGKCDSCQSWNTLVEFRVASASGGKISSHGSSLKSTTIALEKKTVQKRVSTEMSSVDEVLGGGLVAGSVVLIAGEPGIGKSTILLQVAAAISKKQKTLYVSGEESNHQVAIRAARLGLGSSELEFAASTSTDDITQTIAQDNHAIIIVDSIQTIGLSSVDSAPGSVSQITKSAQQLQAVAKQTNTTLLIVGHVTKEGSIAGPKILEHLVDVVLQLEGDRYGGFKMLRAVKNRFGSTNELGIFEMKEKGLVPVENPSAALLAERQTTDGSVVLAALEGSRAILVEVQALVGATSFGYPKRTAVGIDLNRLNLLVAVLNQRTKLDLSDKDVYVNIVGGIKINEPAADLAVTMAIASASKGMSLPEDCVVFGEVGLSGEIRSVAQADKRIAEAKKLGFTNIIGPKDSNGKNSGVSNLRDALNSYLKK